MRADLLLLASWARASVLHATPWMAALIVPAACAQNPVDLQPSLAIAYGVVARPDRTPVVGALVHIHARDPRNCHKALDARSLPDGTARTDSAGSYRAVVKWLHVSRMELCLAVRAIPRPGSDLRDLTVTGARVTFTHESLTPPIDSVKVDVTLLPQR